LGRHDLIYHYGEIVSGVVAINVQGRSGSHTGAILQVDGRVALKPSSKSQTLFSAGPRNPEPLIKISKTLDIPEKLPLGKHQFPFDFALEPADSLLETYQGVYVSVQYEITFTLNRGLLVDKIEKTLEFIVLANPKNEIETKPISFSLSPATVTRSYKEPRLPDFLVDGRIDCDLICASQPVTGTIYIKKCSEPIRAIELQLSRAETIIMTDGSVSKETTEIQNIQIVEGDVCLGLEIPLYMVLPRLFTCSSAVTRDIKIDFELNLVIAFVNEMIVSENFPIRLYR